MNSACAGPRLGRCRVRDLVASCFNTCRLPLEEEPGISGSKPPSPKASSHKASRKTSDYNKRCEEVESCSHNAAAAGGGGGWRGAETEPRFAEEDYIVFCFGEDGEIHMINDTKSSEKYSNDQNQAACIITRKGEEMMMNDDANANASKMDSFESCDSGLSDTSTSSFAFPVMGMEWIGSPLHMPNAEKRDVRACRRCSTF